MSFLPLYTRYLALRKEAPHLTPTVGGFLVHLSDDELAALAQASEKLPEDTLDDESFDDLVLLVQQLARAEEDAAGRPQDLLHLLHQLCVCISLACLVRKGYALANVASLRLAADNLPEAVLTDKAYLLLGSPGSPTLLH